MRKFGMLGIVLIGLTFVMNGVAYVALPFSAWANGATSHWPAMLVELLPALAYLAGGIFLIVRRESLARRLFPDEDAPLSVTSNALVRTGLVLVGAFMMAGAIPGLFTQVATAAVVLSESGQGLGPVDVWQEVPGVAQVLVAFLVGWFLVARSRSLTDRLLREPKPPAPAPVASGPVCPSCGTPFDPADYQGGLVAARCCACGSPLDVTAP
jgi:uncharacterized membrane protein HdeD (DUF308 family)